LYLWLIIETGIVGTVLFMLFLIYLLLHVKKLGVQKYAIPLFGLILVSQLTEFYLEHEEIFVLLFWLVAVSLILPNTLYNDRVRRSYTATN